MRVARGSAEHLASCTRANVSACSANGCGFGDLARSFFSTRGVFLGGWAARALRGVPRHGRTFQDERGRKVPRPAERAARTFTQSRAAGVTPLGRVAWSCASANKERERQNRAVARRVRGGVEVRGASLPSKIAPRTATPTELAIDSHRLTKQRARTAPSPSCYEARATTTSTARVDVARRIAR
jgi:hypothetical protein